MRLDDDGNHFELSLRGYEFARLGDMLDQFRSALDVLERESLREGLGALERENLREPTALNDSDANWLQITVEAATPEGSWSATDPCLLTWDVQRLAMWLDNLASGVRQSPTISFLEPNLSFEQVSAAGDHVKLRVELSHKFEPPWSEDRYSPYALDLTVSRTALSEAAASLRAQLERFPPRSKRESSFAPRPLLPHFRIDWELRVPRDSAVEAEGLVIEYARWIQLEATGVQSEPVPGEQQLWYARFSTPLQASAREPAEAALQLLERLPSTFGMPRVGRFWIAVDGAGGCQGQIEPVPTYSQTGTFAPLRGWFYLANYEDERRFAQLRHWNELSRQGHL